MPERTFSEQDTALVLSAPGLDGILDADREAGGRMRICLTPKLSPILPRLDFEITSLHGEIQVDRAGGAGIRASSARVEGDGLAGALSGYAWAGGYQPDPAEIKLYTTGPATFDDLVSKPATLQAKVYGQAYSYRVAGATPLKVGARFEQGSFAAVIQRIALGESAVDLVLRCRYIFSGFPRMLLVNHGAKEMVEGIHRNQWNQTKPVGFLGTPSVSFEELTLVFPVEFPDANGIVRLSRDWMASAELVFLERVPEGRYETSVRLTNLRTRDSTFEQRPLSAAIRE
jgi:hypothetical protein